MEFIYLHGFASGPSSYKSSYFCTKIESEYHWKSYSPNLNQPDFLKLTISAQLAHLQNEFTGNSYIVMGSSLGAFVALMAAQQKTIPITALILLAPAFEIVERKTKLMGDEQYRNWQKTNQLEVFHHYHQKQMTLSFDLMRDAEKHQFKPEAITVPILLFHGKQDDVVDYRLSQKYLDNYPQVEAYYPESDHLLIDQLDLIWEKSKDFINRIS